MEHINFLGIPHTFTKSRDTIIQGINTDSYHHFTISQTLFQLEAASRIPFRPIRLLNFMKERHINLKDKFKDIPLPTYLPFKERDIAYKNKLSIIFTENNKAKLLNNKQKSSNNNPPPTQPSTTNQPDINNNPPTNPPNE